MRSNDDQEKIKTAREYFTRADQRCPDVLELFHEDAEIYFPSDLDGIRFLKWLKDSTASWNTFNMTMTV